MNEIKKWQMLAIALLAFFLTKSFLLKNPLLKDEGKPRAEALLGDLGYQESGGGIQFNDPPKKKEHVQVTDSGQYDDIFNATAAKLFPKPKEPAKPLKKVKPKVAKKIKNIKKITMPEADLSTSGEPQAVAAEEDADSDAHRPLPPFTSTVINPIAKKNNADIRNLKTLEDWLAFIMPDPTTTKIDQMINAYRLLQIQPDVFVEVSKELLKDNREKAQLGGVRAIGAVRSVETFALLAEVLRSDFSPSVRRLAQAHTSEYQRLENLGILTRVLTMRGLPRDTRLLALQKAEIAARSAERSGGPNLFTAGPNGNLTHPTAIALTRLGQTLDRQKENEPDSDLRRRMTDLAEHLRQVLPS